jgi:hypothetical protein
MLADCFMVAILAAGAAKCDLRARALSTGRSLLQRGRLQFEASQRAHARALRSYKVCCHTQRLKVSKPHHTLTQGMLSPDTTQIAERRFLRLRYELLYAVSLAGRGIVQQVPTSNTSFDMYMYAFTFSRYGSCIQHSPFTIQDSPTPFNNSTRYTDNKLDKN